MSTISVRFHGRGGQGVVTAAELLSVAAFYDGKQAQAFPSFGSERMGAPVVSFCRISDAIIRTREPVSEPDIVVVSDITLLHDVDVFAGLEAHGFAILNTMRPPAELAVHAADGVTMFTIAATDLAREHLGRPLPNPVLLGAVAGLTSAVSMSGLERAVRDRFSGAMGQANLVAMRAGYAAAVEQAVGTSNV